MSPKVAVIILTWNNHEDTSECLNSLKHISYQNLHIVLVDNGSTDGSGDRLRSEFPQVTVLRVPDNKGFAGGNNIGIEFAREREFDYVLLLNNDTVVDRSLLTELLECARGDRSVGAVAPLIYDYRTQKVSSAGGRIDWIRGAGVHLGEGLPSGSKFMPLRQLSFATGCCLLVRVEVFRKTGLFDPDYFLYFEDLDLCTRITRAGYRVSFTPRAVLWHKVNSSISAQSPASIYYRTRNRLMFMHKHASIEQYSVFLAFFFASRVLKISFYLLKREPLKALGLWLGVSDFFAKSFGKSPEKLSQESARY